MTRGLLQAVRDQIAQFEQNQLPTQMIAQHQTNRTTTTTNESRERKRQRDAVGSMPSNPLWQSLAMHPFAVQTKLSVSQPDDPFEQEADRVADRVMRMEVSHANDARISTTAGIIQRKCAGCEDEEEKIQRKAEGAGEPHDSAAQVDQESLRSSGQPLEPNTREFMESRFERDFGSVRVHVDAQADASARSVNALAFTLGRDVAFRAGQYSPNTSNGRRLIAHELAHVIQQTGGQENTRSRGPVAIHRSQPQLQRVVDPEYVVDEPGQGGITPGVPVRIFFARDSAAIPVAEIPKIDTFKSGPVRTMDLTVLGLATEDELAARPSLPLDRATAVSTMLGLPSGPPFHTTHAGAHPPTAGTIANTRGRPQLRFNRAVEILRPGEPSLSPATPIAPATVCSGPLETAFQAAKTMAFDWINVTRPDVQARPIPGPVAAALDRFFGNHTDATARRVDHNLGLIHTEIGSLAQPANHDCADPNLPSCVGAIAFNSGGRMTICAGYLRRTPEDLTRNLVHEAGHSTAGLRVTGGRNAPRTTDFAYRYERMINMLGQVNPDQALSNSDSYALFLMTQRARAAITPEMLPTSDPAPAGFSRPRDAEKTRRAIALAEVWLRLAHQGLTDLHTALRGIGTGRPVPSTLGDPARLDPILAKVKVEFPPILSLANITTDDLLMIAGVMDSYGEVSRLVKNPIATAPGASTSLTRVAPAVVGGAGSLSLTVDSTFLAASDRVAARTVIDKLIELVPVARISVRLRPGYGRFAEFVRNMHQ